MEKACSRSVVHSEALSQLPESRLVIHQVMRADVIVLKFIWLFCGYRERFKHADFEAGIEVFVLV